MVTETRKPLETEINAFEQRRAELERDYLRKWVVFRGERLIGAWDTLDAAAKVAVARFGRGPYLIRRVGVPLKLPPSLLVRRRPSL